MKSDWNNEKMEKWPKENKEWKIEKKSEQERKIEREGKKMKKIIKMRRNDAKGEK